MHVAVYQVKINTKRFFPFIFSCKGITSTFPMAICMLSVAIFAKSFHTYGTVANPVDLAPKHTGSIAGITQTIAATSGWSILAFNIFSIGTR